MKPTARAQVPQKYIQALSPNVITVDSRAIDSADPRVIVGGKRFDLFRNNGDFGTFIAKPPGQLGIDDICAIDKACDQVEGTKNKGVKQVLADALSRFFNRTSFHMTEIGCGKVPVVDYFKTPNLTWHGVEVDPDCIHHIQTHMHRPASTWAALPPVPVDRPAIATSVYALHFMVNRNFPKQIESVMNKDGFFVGNMYLDPVELRERRQTKFFENILNAGRMDFIRIADPACRTNEYWIIAKAGSSQPMQDFAAVLEATLRGRPVAAKQTSLPQNTYQ